MDVFMAKPNSKDYGKWLGLFTMLAMLGIAASKWYYPVLFHAKGFAWDASLTFFMVMLCALHAWRLFSINGLLNQASANAFGRWNIISLVLHLALIGAFVVLGKSYTPYAASVLLLVAEACTLVFFQWIKRRSHV
jgi:hypothetical protein